MRGGGLPDGRAGDAHEGQEGDRWVDLKIPDGPTRPNAARIYDYWLGGRDHYACDREVGDQVAAQAPWAPLRSRACRTFLRDGVAFLAGHGIGQFFDIGSGLPTAGNVHQIAQQVNPAARVVYIDHDPVVLAHAHALLEGDDGVHGSFHTGRSTTLHDHPGPGPEPGLTSDRPQGWTGLDRAGQGWTGVPGTVGRLPQAPGGLWQQNPPHPQRPGAGAGPRLLDHRHRHAPRRQARQDRRGTAQHPAPADKHDSLRPRSPRPAT